MRRGRAHGLAAWTTVAAVAGNTASVTDHPVGIAGVVDVQVLVDVPTQILNPATRIYEVEVWGTPTASGVLGGNVVQLPVTTVTPVRTCTNSVVTVDGTQSTCL